MRTTDLGATWEDISGFGANSTSSNGFPDVAVYSLLVMPHETNTIWAGTEIGLVVSTDNGASWNLANNGFPSASVWQMKVVDDQVVVATHGRGIWSVTIPELPAIDIVPGLLGLGTYSTGELVLKKSLNSNYDSTIVFLNGERVSKINANSEPTERLYKVDVSTSTDEFVKVKVVGYKDGRSLPSIIDSVKVDARNEITNAYADNLNSGSSDFIIEDRDFLITKFAGFNNLALHSKHDYEEGQTFPAGFKNYTATLKTPVVVNSENATFTYKDVAIIETGEPGVFFGDDEFWDYVIVEATKNGIDWTPLEDGYDANLHPDWLAAYTSGSKGDASMFKSHSIDLRQKFSIGDTLLFRFRLFSDPLTVGYGWVIDDIAIQGTVTDVKVMDQLSNINVYPNPAADYLQLTITMERNERVTAKILTIDGRVQSTHDLGVMGLQNNTAMLTTDKLSSGFHVLVVEYADKRQVEKFLINR